MGFIRVRAATGPLHEFDVAEAELAAFPDIYEVLDPEPVDEARAASYVVEDPDPEPPAPTPTRTPPKRPKK
ncbi:hypothetical protein [Microbacterium hydrocarbonoxydans]|uniref:hypothetical protein n=1 Tax=Microbacterium hydrocarbonoxydans TaxID=273678 RepID=UPI003D99F34E